MQSDLKESYSRGSGVKVNRPDSSSAWAPASLPLAYSIRHPSVLGGICILSVDSNIIIIITDSNNTNIFLKFIERYCQIPFLLHQETEKRKEELVRLANWMGESKDNF